MIILPSLEIVPAKYNVSTNTLLSQIPIDGTGDFTVTRNTAARRFDSAGLIASVASGIPRLDYFTSGGVTGCPALLVEPAATNGILNSADTTTSWTLGANLTSGSIDVIGVSGNNLTVATPSSIGQNAGVLRRTGNSVALASGSTYTISFLMKKTGTHTIGGYYALITGAASGDLAAGFDVSGSFSSGQIFAGYTAATNRIRRVEQWGTDVFRCSETFTMSASGTLTTFHFAPVAGVTSPANSASGTTMGFAAPQIELGSVPTSFIPTTAGTGSRSADIISVSGAVSGSIGQTEGTLYFEIDVQKTATATRNVVEVTDGTSSNRFFARLYDDSGTQRLEVALISSGGFAARYQNLAMPAGIYKVAFGYALNNFACFVNGIQNGSTDTSGNCSASYSTINLGSAAGNVSFFNDRIRAAALYTTRLTNAQLEFLTSPYTSYSQMATTLSYTIL